MPPPPPLQLLQPYSREERLARIAHYRAKRERCLAGGVPTIKYACRQRLAESRARIGGRFARSGQPGSILPSNKASEALPLCEAIINGTLAQPVALDAGGGVAATTETVGTAGTPPTTAIAA